ncbi:helix-turn-helix domain-containing protein [Phocaeicola coprophilus]|uniref:helix-turn-helix domain-containing protein n=1 Tax=Phocaeicola coprophilus TaxID=387090 RepID=UPI00215D2069|nr:helix-turn-helix domain-containing protein [Phocaeicola coprophilus]
MNISTTYLSRIVKNITGHTVRFHLSELLGADARRMLECTDLDVQEISNQLGFSDQSVFGKFFIRQTGLSPLKFRMRKEELRKQ